ncbi:MAG: hypothetical protein GPJ51_11180 [Candidatus Heimdallarchaeota archaeon]|nr:hypothetical protein [Candidatus Heimdallarchaeota archaeon]
MNSNNKRKPRGYWTGKEGLENAKQKYIEIAKQIGRRPTTQHISSIIRPITKGVWKEFGINDWPDFVRYCGFEPETKRGTWKGKEGLERARKEIIKFKDKHGRTPKLTEVSGGIHGALKHRYWKELGIIGWFNLLDYLQIEYSRGEPRKWKGKEGLEEAKQNYIEISKQIGKRATSHHVSGIDKAIKRGVWQEFGITEWQEFVRYCGFKPKTKMYTWTGKEGLDKAKKKYIKIAKEIGKRPTAHHISTILKPISKGVWKEFGINDWPGFVRYCGFKPDTKRGTWKGKEGLERAVKELNDFHEKSNRVPTINEVHYGIVDRAFSGGWRGFGIESWNDLLGYCGFEPNIDHDKWKGKEGFEKAKKLVLRKYKEIGRSPNSSEVPGGIHSHIFSGGWKEYGISSWTDLVIDCGLNPNVGYQGIAWLKWERWCEKALRIIYPSKSKKKDQLPNGRIPDFLVRLTKNSVLIIDAKISAFSSGIEHDIKNYIDFCNKLEFWCLFGQRDIMVRNNREICFLNPQSILKQVREKEKKKKLIDELLKLYEYARSEYEEIAKNKITKDEYQKTLDYWIEDR